MKCKNPVNEMNLKRFIANWDNAPRGRTFKLIGQVNQYGDTKQGHLFLLQNKAKDRYALLIMDEIKNGFEFTLSYLQ